MYTPSDDGGTVQITRGRKRRDVPPFYAPGLDATIVTEALAINILIPLRFYVVLACRLHAGVIRTRPPALLQHVTDSNTGELWAAEKEPILIILIFSVVLVHRRALGIPGTSTASSAVSPASPFAVTLKSPTAQRINY